MAVHYLNFRIESENAMLTDFLRRKLNPLQIHVVAMKDIPFKTEPKYKPIFSSCDFIDGK